MGVPAPTKAWLAQARLVDDDSHREAVGQMLEWISGDESGFLEWRTGDLTGHDLEAMNTAFAVSLVYLHTCWSACEAPARALEELVSAFGVGGLEAMWAGDGDLPHDAAGLWASEEDGVLWPHWESHLASFVTALFEEGHLSAASPLASRYVGT